MKSRNASVERENLDGELSRELCEGISSSTFLRVP